MCIGGVWPYLRPIGHCTLPSSSITYLSSDCEQQGGLGGQLNNSNSNVLCSLRYLGSWCAHDNRTDSRNPHIRTFKRASSWTLNGNIEVPQVVVVWGGSNAWRGVRNEAFCFLIPVRSRHQKSKMYSGLRYTSMPKTIISNADIVGVLLAVKKSLCSLPPVSFVEDRRKGSAAAVAVADKTVTHFYFARPSPGGLAITWKTDGLENEDIVVRGQWPRNFRKRKSRFCRIVLFTGVADSHSDQGRPKDARLALLETGMVRDFENLRRMRSAFREGKQRRWHQVAAPAPGYPRHSGRLVSIASRVCSPKDTIFIAEPAGRRVLAYGSGRKSEAINSWRSFNHHSKQTANDPKLEALTVYKSRRQTRFKLKLYLAAGFAAFGTKTERWIQFPAHAECKDSIVQALCNAITDIIALLESKVRHDRTATRTVIDSREKKLINVGAHTQYSSPTLVITATGSSFEPASERGGYTDVATCFIVDIESAMHCLEDQIILLGVQILIQQTNREYVRCFYMTEKSIRFIHFDRAGAQFGPFVNIHEEPETFVQYILGACSFDEEQLGFDTSVVWKHDENGKKISGYISVTDENNIRTRYPMRMVDPWVAHPEIESRGLKVWKVSDPRSGKDLIIKDSWVGGHRAPEWQHLQRAKGIPGVVQMISMEAKCFPFTGTMRATPSMTPYDNPTQYYKSKSRVILEQYGSKLVSCEDERQFLTASRDAIAGMQGLNDAGLLHRDVSWGNVLLGNENASSGDRGVLIDLDMAYDANEFSEERNMGCGTPGYMSINVLTRNTDKDFKRRYIRDHLDDLESAFYVLCEAAFKWQNPQCHAPIHAIYLTTGDAEAAAKAKRRLFEAKTLNANDVVPTFGPETKKVLQSFFKFLKDVIKAKDKYYANRSEKDRLAAAMRLINQKDKHYAEVLAFFDKAIKKLGPGESGSASAGKQSESSEPLTSPRRPLFPLKINLPDFLS
ncbi:hypothetical protein NMY22_g12521 [Coprinellus aureogranulatus]|nr:hypothetical protein NMY22_g12521 [Coprinellus aureogranulatus]